MKAAALIARPTQLITIPAVALALLTLAAPPAGAGSHAPHARPVEEEVRESWTLREGATVTVTNINGPVRVSAWDRPEAELHAVKRTHHGSEALANAVIDIDTGGGDLAIRTRHLENNPRVTIEYTLTVPRTARVTALATTNGPVELTGTTGDTALRTTNGPILVRDVDGLVEARTTNGGITVTGSCGIRSLATTNGDIEATGARFCERTSLTTTNGSVDLRVPGLADARVSLATTNGRVRADGVGLTATKSGRTSLDGVLGNGGAPDITVRTTNGGITLGR